MSLLHHDSFDSYTDATQAWDAGGGAIGTAYGRNSTQGIQFTAGGYVKKNISNIASFYCGFALYINSLSSWNTIFEAYDPSSSSSVQLGLRIDSGGHLYAIRGNPGSPTILGTSSLALSFKAWHYIEISGTISSTAGSVEVRVDGSITYISLSGVDTQVTSNSYIGEYLLGPHNGFSCEVWMDDHYFLSNDATAPNSFQGNVRLVWTQILTAGTNAQWTPTGAANNQDCVNDDPPDDDTTYNFSSTPGQVDTFGHAALPSGLQNVLAVGLRGRARSDTGAGVIHLAVLSGGTLGESADLALGSVYADFTAPFPVDPATGSAWGDTAWNNAEIGYKEIS